MADCPPVEILDRLLAETLDVRERSQIETHVVGCEDCQNTLNNLTSETAVKGSSVLLSAQPERGNSQTEAFFERLKRMKPPTGGDASQQSRLASEKQDDLPQVEGYDIIEEIGRGSAGVVYRARHRKLNRLVALKMIAAGPQLSPAMRQRFRAEALAIARLKHPNIVQVYDVGEHGEFPYLSLELIAGGSLADWTAGKPRPPFEAAQIVATLAEAVEYAHRQGVVHRDLKPSNVLLGVQDRPGKRELKITDFGIAKVLPQAGISGAQMTQAGEILGTPAYMAPEQARGNVREITPPRMSTPSGAMLYEMLTGRPPFQGATPLDTLMQAVRQDPVAISPPGTLVCRAIWRPSA
jgi:serine/threonine protein kinase